VVRPASGLIQDPTVIERANEFKVAGPKKDARPSRMWAQKIPPTTGRQALNEQFFALARTRCEELPETTGCHSRRIGVPHTYVLRALSMHPTSSYREW